MKILLIIFRTFNKMGNIMDITNRTSVWNEWLENEKIYYKELELKIENFKKLRRTDEASIDKLINMEEELKSSYYRIKKIKKSVFFIKHE